MRIGHFEVIRTIRSGGVAEILLARHVRLPVNRAVKRLLPALAKDLTAMQRLLREARLGATFHHPNLVKIDDMDEADGRAYVLMEWVDGPDLRDVIAEMSRRGIRALSLGHTVAIVSGVLAALEHVHTGSLRVVHRDISPTNVMVNASGVVKLIDFGMAQSTIEGLDDRGLAVGKPGYMSPEQARGELVDARSDLFSVGTLLYELTTSRRLFVGATAYETVRLVADRAPPRPTEILPGYPAALEAIVMRALARDLGDRYPTAAAMKRDLDAFVLAEKVDASPAALADLVANLGLRSPSSQ